MNKILFAAIFVTSTLSLNAQDILVRKGGDIESVKVLEVSPTEVKYKKTNNEDGPVFIEKRSNLYSVRYKNGEVLLFNKAGKKTSQKDMEKKVSETKDHVLSEENTNLISVKNQFGEAQRINDRLEKGKDTSSYYDNNGKGRFTHELDFYIANGWGIGYQLRREFNPYIGWNIVGISYVSGFKSPADDGLLDIKLMGLRGYTPSYKYLRGYVELNVGYSLSYERIIHLRYPYNNYYFYEEETELDTNHRLGVDLSIGVQVYKRIAIGYNMKFTDPSLEKTHFARITILF